jgi:hypothetical protein
LVAHLETLQLPSLITGWHSAKVLPAQARNLHGVPS